MIDITTDADKALTVGVHEGVLKGSGRMIVGTVSSEVYRRIEEYARKASGGSNMPTNTELAAAKPVPEQSMNNVSASVATSSVSAAVPTTSPDSKPIAAASPPTASTGKPDNTSAAPNPWETLRVGARVLAAYWGEKREFEGFWLATVKRIDKGEFTLEWVEAPEYPTFKTTPKNIAVPHPEFRALGK